MNYKFKLVPLFLIFIAVLARLLPHQANFAPITAIALFGAVYLPKKYAFIIPVFSMLISDFFIGFYGVTMVYVYGSFLLSGLIGLWLRNHKNPASLIGCSLFSSVLFFAITNFGVWADPVSMYPKNFSGLMDSYFMGLPFFKNTVTGDLFYSVVLFGGYEVLFRLSKKYLPKNLSQIIF